MSYSAREHYTDPAVVGSYEADRYTSALGRHRWALEQRAVNRILAVLLEKMSFPQYAPDGLPLSYKFHHKASGKQLLDTQCLADVGVKDGDILRLQPEITAGAGSWGISNLCAAAVRSH